VISVLLMMTYGNWFWEDLKLLLAELIVLTKDLWVKERFG